MTFKVSVMLTTGEVIRTQVDTIMDIHRAFSNIKDLNGLAFNDVFVPDRGYKYVVFTKEEAPLEGSETQSE